VDEDDYDLRLRVARNGLQMDRRKCITRAMSLSKTLAGDNFPTWIKSFNRARLSQGLESARLRDASWSGEPGILSPTSQERFPPSS
jgi:hypothetical protein